MTRNRIILLVEDNADDADLTVRAFEKSQIVHQMVVVRDGLEALNYLFGEGEFAGRDPQLAPEVVLLDLNLPKLNGLDVLRRMRADERTRRVPVVMLTSSKEEGDRLKSYNLGANSFVRKPVNSAEFLDAARQLGVYWLDVNVNAAPHSLPTKPSAM
jgi:two-component system, response regulator